MGTMARIRETSPFVIGSIVVLFLLFMVISDTNLATLFGGKNLDPATAEVAVINGEKILYRDFEAKVKEAVEQQRAQMAQQTKNPDVDIDEAPIREQVFNQMIEETLMRQEAKKMGITVSNDEILDIMLEDPPQYLRNILPIFNDSLGNFNKKLYVDVMTNPDMIANFISKESGLDPQKIVGEFKSQLVKIEDYLLQMKLQNNVSSAIGTSMSSVPPSVLTRKYVVDNSTADVEIAMVTPTAMIDTNVIKVSDQEIESYYTQYKETFRQKNSRRVKYAVLPMVPSDLDSQKVKRKLDTLTARLNRAQTLEARDTVFQVFGAENAMKTTDFTHISDLGAARINTLSALKEREVVGPVKMFDGDYFFRLDGRRTGENVVVRASHILVRFNNNKDSAKTAVEKIKKEVTKENFAELAAKYSTDGSAQQGGDLNYFGKGKMVKEFEEAAFGASVGQIVGPVETQFGYHIIYVTDKKADELKFSEIRLAPTFSTVTKNSLISKARDLKSEVEKGANFDSAAKKLNIKSNQTGFFPRSQQVLNSRSLTAFAFENDKNKVSEPTEIKGFGIVLVQVTDVRLGGIKPVEDVRDEIKNRLMRRKIVASLKQKAEGLYAKVTSAGSFSAVKQSDSSFVFQTISGVKDNGQIQGIGVEPFVTGKIFQTPAGKIVLAEGDRGWYIVNVVRRTDADASKAQNELPKILASEAGKLRQQGFYRYMSELRESSKIEDLRSQFYRD